MRRFWTKEKLEWLIENSKLYKDRREILIQFNQRFSTSYTLRQLSLASNEHKISLPRSSLKKYKRYNPWLSREKTWTNEKLAWLISSKDTYDDREDILNAFNKKFNTKATLKDLKTINTKYSLALPKANRLIQKSLEASWISSRGFTEKQIGDDISWGNSQVCVKVSYSKVNSERYMLKARYLYQKYHNIKLSTKDCIIFLDGDTNNFSKDNLYKSSRFVIGTMVGHKLNNTKSIDKETVIKYCEWKEKIIQLVRESKMTPLQALEVYEAQE